MLLYRGLIVALLASGVHAFAPLSAPTRARPCRHGAPDQAPATLPNSLGLARNPTSLRAMPSLMTAAAAAEGNTATSSIMSSHLMNFFLETLISLAVPTVLGLVAIAVVARIFRSNESKSRGGRRRNEDMDMDDSAVAMLYTDLYGDQAQDMSSRGSNKGLLQQLLRPGRSGSDLPKNIGIPAQEYISINNLNQKFQSYQYSMTAATQTKALAASQYRNSALRKALVKSLAGTTSNGLPPLENHQLAQLAETEKEFLQDGKELAAQLNNLQAQLTEQALDEEIEAMGLESAYELDPAPASSKDVAAKEGKESSTNNKLTRLFDRTGNANKKKQAALFKQIANVQLQMAKLELQFRQDIISIAGPEHAASLKAALIGSSSSSLLTTLQDRPLSQVLGVAATADGDSSLVSLGRRPNLFVTNFPGDASASQVRELREEVTAICQAAQTGDEALVILQTGGGTVTGYGLATAQLIRLKEKGLKLTIAVEQVAASGGYMMCCVADHIVASPFAVLGSIGVISDIPNVYERLKSEGIEFQTVTAGKFKRTLTPTKKVTKEDMQKTAKDIEEVFVLFRDFVAQNRPQLDIENVATGETWFGTAALERKLCDEIKAVDDVILDYVRKGFEVLEVEYTPPVDTVFGTLSPARAEKNNGLVGNGIRWLVTTIASEVKAEVGSGLSTFTTSPSVEERVVAQDSTAERTRMQS